MKIELMTLDHIAYRVANRDETVDFLCSLFGYEVGAEFKINFDDGSIADCKALVDVYHKASPEVFVSDGSPDSIVEMGKRTRWHWRYSPHGLLGGRHRENSKETKRCWCRIFI